MKLLCKICSKEFEIGRLMIHLKKTHNINTEEYYQENIKNENTICSICQINKKRFIGFKEGYTKTCCNLSCKGKFINLNNKENQINGCIKRNEKWKKEIINGKSKQQIIIENGQQKRDKKQHETNKKISNKLKGNLLLCGDNNSMKNPKTIDKLRSIFKLKYGVDWITQNEKIKEQSKLTMISKYGVDNYVKTDEYKEHIKQLNHKKMVSKISKYFIENDLEFISDINLYENSTETIIKFKCLKCQTVHSKMWNAIDQWWNCKVCNPNFSTSSQEKEITDFLHNNNITFEKSAKIIKNPNSDKYLELDFYIPDKNLAIEFNGLYWHCDKHQLNNNYHLLKTSLCKEKGIQLIHIFEDEWILKKDIVISRLKNLLHLNNEKIYSRKCIIEAIDFKTKQLFLEKNHIQNNDVSSVNLGLFHNSQLVSVMTFSHGSISKGKKRENDVWELSRFCNKLNCNIVGSASKLLSYFKKNYQWKEIYSYADKRWSNGNLYHILGFKLDYETQPNYWYINLSKDVRRYHRFNFRKSVLKNLKSYDTNLNEIDIMKKEGWNLIYDCGNLKFSLKNSIYIYI